MDGIAQASLHGDRAHVIVDPQFWTPDKLVKALEQKGTVVQSVETVQSTLEDVFTLLAHRGKENSSKIAGSLCLRQTTFTLHCRFSYKCRPLVVESGS